MTEIFSGKKCYIYEYVTCPTRNKIFWYISASGFGFLLYLRFVFIFRAISSCGCFSAKLIMFWTDDELQCQEKKRNVMSLMSFVWLVVFNSGLQFNCYDSSGTNYVDTWNIQESMFLGFCNTGLSKKKVKTLKKQNWKNQIRSFAVVIYFKVNIICFYFTVALRKPLLLYLIGNVRWEDKFCVTCWFFGILKTLVFLWR